MIVMGDAAGCAFIQMPMEDTLIGKVVYHKAE